MSPQAKQLKEMGINPDDFGEILTEDEVLDIDYELVSPDDEDDE
jgi:hypothetical protein